MKPIFEREGVREREREESERDVVQRYIPSYSEMCSLYLKFDAYYYYGEIDVLYILLERVIDEIETQKVLDEAIKNCQ